MTTKKTTVTPDVLHEVTVQREDGHRTVVRVMAADEDGARDKVAAMDLRRHEVVDVTRPTVG